MSALSVDRAASLAVAAIVLALALAIPAQADHPMDPVRPEGLSPLAFALVTGGLALAAALLVVVIAMLVLRKPSDPEQAEE
jgi:ABC-type branched-subunit amino acid transport system permease subunit